MIKSDEVNLIIFGGKKSDVFPEINLKFFNLMKLIMIKFFKSYIAQQM